MDTFEKILNLNDVNSLIADLKKARNIYDKIESEATLVSIMFGIFTLIPGIDVFVATVLGIATLANSVYALDLDNIENIATKAIEELENYKELLLTGKYDLIKLKMSVKYVTLNGKQYAIPYEFEPTAIHSISGGWQL
jgi:hypothetical protein